jgi:uncharacterized membrane protein YozB (DUF420 family)
MTTHDLPLLNAFLNGTAAVLLFVARRTIKQGRTSEEQRTKHKYLMIAAFTTSILFLISYLVYHYSVGSVSFQGTGASRPIYFTILISHTLLAVAVPVLATMTLIRGLKARYQKHVKIAVWTYPVWMYVSATGVIIYLMLYQLFPSAQMAVLP